MAIIKNLDYENEKSKKTVKKKKCGRPKKNSNKIKEEKITKNMSEEKPRVKKSGSFLGGIIAIVVILVIIGLVFAYTNGKLSKLQQSGAESQALAQQVEDLQQEIKTLTEKAKNLEEQNKESKDVVIDLFDKNRALPDNVDLTGWLVYANDKLNYQIQVPQNWQVAKTEESTPEKTAEQPIEKTEEESKDKATTEKTEEVEAVVPKQQITVHLQPKDEPNFVLAMTVKNDYLDLTPLTLAEKYELFKGLNFIDQKDFSAGKMLYYIDLDKNNNQIPTILILTEQDIYKMTFNVIDKTLSNYMTYRLDFEEIASTFKLVKKAEPAATETKEEPKAE